VANTLYTNYAHKVLGLATAAHALPDMDSAAIYAALTDHGTLTPLPATHQDYADIAAGTVGTPVVMTGPAIATGALDYDNFTWLAVAGASCESINWYDFATAAAATSPLILYMDTATGMPVTPTGANIVCTVAAAGLLVLIS